MIEHDCKIHAGMSCKEAYTVVRQRLHTIIGNLIKTVYIQAHQSRAAALDWELAMVRDMLDRMDSPQNFLTLLESTPDMGAFGESSTIIRSVLDHHTALRELEKTLLDRARRDKDRG